MTFAVKTFNNINPKGLEYLGNDFQVDGEISPEAFILRSENLHEYEFPESLLAIARAGAGTNNIPIAEASKQGIVVFNTPGANANAVKEAVLASLLFSARDYIKASAWTQALTGENIPKQVEAGKKQFAGTEIQGKKLGVIGLGAIGAMVANDAYRLGMEVVGYDPYVSVETAWSISRRVGRVDDVNDIFETCDYITIHVPLTDETRGIIGREACQKMKRGTVVLNFARGELVDNEAMFGALEAGVVRKYITDFGTDQVLHHENITVLPHVGGSTEEAEFNCAVMASQTIRRFLETGEIINSVNFPNVKQVLAAPTRITLVHENVPNMIGRISKAVSDFEINIDNLVNRSRGDYAYTLLDIEEEDETKIQGILERFNAAENVLRARLIRK
ncbi:MAG: phosphoglycerate dehydrogenase [Streptococcaceae bacterium]|jgi:D-3-phosphoglycerate dehydrogenase|nr:phosphoglycerate dehydrogenase [Streptococcaceae bacterium]